MSTCGHLLSGSRHFCRFQGHSTAFFGLGCLDLEKHLELTVQQSKLWDRVAGTGSNTFLGG